MKELNTLKITDSLKANRDKSGWTLTWSYNGQDKDGNDKVQTREFYYGNLGGCLRKALDIDAGSCKSLVDVIKSLEAFVNLTEEIK